MSEISEKNRLGGRLAFAIKKLGFLSYPDFIKQSGLSSSTFYTIMNEDRKPNSKTAKKLYDMGINVNWVVDGIGGPLLPNADERQFRIDENVIREQERRYGRENDEIPQAVAESGIKAQKSEMDESPSWGNIEQVTRNLRNAIEVWEAAMAQGNINDERVEQVTDLRTQILISLVKLIPRLEMTDLKLIRELVNGELQKKIEVDTKQ